MDTCSTIVDRRGSSATSAAISIPRFIGPGCMTMASSGSSPIRCRSSPYRRLYSRSDGKYAWPIRSRCTRSIITTSALGRLASRSYETPAGQASTPTGSRVGGATRVTSAPRVASSSTLERATRLCSTSPTTATRRPSRRPSRRRIVYASSSAWVGCSWVPSPALTTLPRSQPASRCGAPDSECRTTTASAPIASRVSAVSLSDSPLDTLEPFAEKVTTSADSRLAASSNEIRVRVESSKKRLTTVRPRSVGSFLTSRPTSCSSIRAAVSSTASASSRVRSAADSRCLTASLRSRCEHSRSRAPPVAARGARRPGRRSRPSSTRTFSSGAVGMFLPT